MHPTLATLMVARDAALALDYKTRWALLDGLVDVTWRKCRYVFDMSACGITARAESRGGDWSRYFAAREWGRWRGTPLNGEPWLASNVAGPTVDYRWVRQHEALRKRNAQ